jgi:hypothetical protein
MSPEPTVEQLIEAARTRAGDDDALALLDAVTALAQDVGTRADAAVDHVVRQARDAGHSWTVIGERLGVSRQAARQRYAERAEQPPKSLGVIRGRDLESVMAAALETAKADSLPEAGTEHLLLGLMTDGVAAATLEQLGATREKIRDASRRLFDYPSGTTRSGQAAFSARATFSAEANAALFGAEQLSTERTPVCAPIVVSTPQLLAVIATNPGSRGRRVLNEMGVSVADIKSRLHCYINVPRTPLGRRSRRRRRDEAQARCSFCGHLRTEERRLVAGPNVWICADCVTLCGEILAMPAGDR